MLGLFRTYAFIRGMNFACQAGAPEKKALPYSAMNTGSPPWVRANASTGLNSEPGVTMGCVGLVRAPLRQPPRLWPSAAITSTFPDPGKYCEAKPRRSDQCGRMLRGKYAVCM